MSINLFHTISARSIILVHVNYASYTHKMASWISDHRYVQIHWRHCIPCLRSSTCIVSSGALNSTRSLTHSLIPQSHRSQTCTANRKPLRPVTTT